MSDDGSTEPYVSDYEELSMELVIETLTGTTFEMTVSPLDNILSIKNKIQRVEGIPVTQQHLLFRFQELGNEVRLCDRGIMAGSTLCLVLSMRGGPISTRRLASGEHHFAWREIKEEDLLEKLPPGSKVTVLLFRDGENVNLIRVVENEDGSCYPYAESWPPTKSHVRDSSHPKYNDRSAENNVLMRKVIELRQKMEGLSVQKKSRKPGTDNTIVAVNQPLMSRVLDELPTVNLQTEHIPKIRKENSDNCRIEKSLSEMYSDRLLLIEQRRNNKTHLGHGHFPHRLNTSLSISTKSEDISVPDRSCATIQTPSIAILEEESDPTLNKNDADLSPPNPIGVSSGGANTVAMSQLPSLPSTSRNLIHLAHVVLRNNPDRPKSSPDKCDSKQREFCNLLFNDEPCHNSVQTEVSSRRKNMEFSGNLKSNLPKIPNAGASGSHMNCLENDIKNEHNYSNDLDKECTQSFSNGLFGPSGSNLLTSQFASTSKLNSAHLDNMLGDRVNESSNSVYNNERRSPLYGRRARIERIRNSTVDINSYDNYGYSNLGYNAKIEKIQNNAVSLNKTMSPQYRRRTLNFVSNLEQKSNCDSNSFELRPFKISKRKCDMHLTAASSKVAVEDTSPEIQTLPAIVPKKRTRCAMCNKKLNITTIHTCRCGGVYCSQHRYSEVHGCHYDYKAEGRKFLEQANPLVAAPKLPKI